MNGVKVTFNGMTSILNLTKIYQLVQKLREGIYVHTTRQKGDLINPFFPLHAGKQTKNNK
jgi:hypothetical protein